MRYMISEYCNIAWNDIYFEHGAYGKPYISNIDNFHFSLSNSADLIVFVHDINEIGIDAEKITVHDIEVAKNFFTKEEYEYILSSPQENNAFYEVWTKKEAYLKMLGIGLSKPLNSFSVFSNEISKMFLTVEFYNYCISVCCHSANISSLLPIEITFEDIQKKFIPDHKLCIT